MKKIHKKVKSIEVLSQDSPIRKKYLELHRLKIKNHYPDGSHSKEYHYETIMRRHLDAVAVLLFEKGTPEQIILRRTLRPAIAMRVFRDNPTQKQIFPEKEDPVLLEVVAGLLEENDQGEEGIRSRAVKEIWEEGGLKASVNDLISLGKPIFPTPGMNPEKIYLYACPVILSNRVNPPGDGSAVEEIGGLVAFDLNESLIQCQKGAIQDAKTEICLYRFQKTLKN